ncbi:MAG: hypothetical protein LKI98_04565 [Bifidobacterium crudilactis]|nr:hypothetical protein [Bifidobacterium crudilactis]MCI1889694.1 hypothetical protein [Bifidobacterium crudilactis]
MDVAGLLDSVNGQPVRWDSAVPLPVLTGIASTSVASLGLVTGIDGRWVAPGYRAARADSEDPCQPGGAVMVRGLPDGVSLDAAGTVSVDKLARMGARVYDPATMGFLSRDPLPDDPGSVWASNPYEYTANNPLMFSDPLGLKPLTDEQLQHHNDTDNWMANHWEYFVAAAVAGGIALMCTGVGGVFGYAMMADSGALVSGGFSIGVQKAENGDVSWSKVTVDAAIGVISGGGESALTKVVVKQLGTTAGKAYLTRFAASTVYGAVNSGAQGAFYNHIHRKPWLDDIWQNLAAGAVGGGLNGISGSGVRGLTDDQISKDFLSGTMSRSDAVMNKIAVRGATTMTDMANGAAQQGVKDRLTGKDTH